ncbi:MAG: hypothetical protein ACI304_04330 [Lepagella sp.]
MTGSVNSTSFSLSGSYTMDDAVFKSERIAFNGETFEGHKIALTGLKPETEYSVKYTVTTQGGSSQQVKYDFTTTALELEILAPKPVSEKCAIVAARTNMGEEELSAGFQWRKYDAPETLPSSEAFAVIYDGQLEGYLKGLQSSSYYNVRAFYKDADGKYYFSD